MDDTFNHVTFYYPNAFQQMRGFPAYCPVANHMQGVVSSGGGGGFGSHGLHAAFGEFIERSHFYLNIHSDIKAEISQYNDQTLTNSLCNMINQLKIINDDPKSHPFHLTKVSNIFNNEAAYLPTVMLTLSFFNEEDRKYIPFMDSCGEAAHISLEKAYRSSLLEFLERQSLVESWMTRQYRYKIDPKVLLRIPKYSRLAKQLLNNGEVHVFDVTTGLEGYVVMILYFSKSKEDYVQYAVGVSGGLTPQEALSKALNELWLDYSYLYTAADVWSKVNNIPEGKKYTVRHIEDNNVEKTRKIIAYDLTADCIEAAEYLELPEVSVESAIASIQKISSQVFLYHRQDVRGDYHYTKIMSPDFFLHMSVTDTLNMDNLYHKKCGSHVSDLYRHVIPFP